MVISHSVSLRPSLLMYALYGVLSPVVPLVYMPSGVLSLVGTYNYFPSVTCDAIPFLNISANIYNAFKSSIPGDRKGEYGNGLLSASVISMYALVARYFDGKYSNWHCCG